MAPNSPVFLTLRPESTVGRSKLGHSTYIEEDNQTLCMQQALTWVSNFKPWLASEPARSVDLSLATAQAIIPL
ncbi:hypothetical protein EYR41_010965 [Orbilia oligospora]|uniref:Uncharacterized protein n=1 Tax=Orbilia oligospora TaxID=2813651 RepID=A0A7C8PMM2_ORBOL|nr:hypothetical protein TWF751_004927 [Orbilia oligospora]KAF3267522.1 hypothetical protein TWF128_009064 [Orbilia oligospora]KAF3284979.1 hypothetical protein TWF132_009643 [Orbilia oligospora]TGJ63015.1 hypothetical protein EYR41_010965 [Orbilia oligospora]